MSLTLKSSFASLSSVDSCLQPLYIMCDHERVLDGVTLRKLPMVCALVMRPRSPVGRLCIPPASPADQRLYWCDPAHARTGFSLCSEVLWKRILMRDIHNAICAIAASEATPSRTWCRISTTIASSPTTTSVENLQHAGQGYASAPEHEQRGNRRRTRISRHHTCFAITRRPARDFPVPISSRLLVPFT